MLVNNLLCSKVTAIFEAYHYLPFTHMLRKVLKFYQLCIMIYQWVHMYSESIGVKYTRVGALGEGVHSIEYTLYILTKVVTRNPQFC